MTSVGFIMKPCYTNEPEQISQLLIDHYVNCCAKQDEVVKTMFHKNVINPAIHFNVKN